MASYRVTRIKQMWEVLESIENSGFATWVRETPSVLGYSTVLALHTFGMSFLVGLTAMIALRTLGFARGLPLAPMERFFPLIIIGFWVNALTGVVLTMLAARSFFSNPDFYIKLTAIAGAIVSLQRLRASLFGRAAPIDTAPAPMKARIEAVAMLAFWAVAVTSGRLIAYSSSVRVQSAIAVTIAAFALLLARHIAARLSRVSGPHMAPATRPAAN
jgi:hypothetical protein